MGNVVSMHQYRRTTKRSRRVLHSFAAFTLEEKTDGWSPLSVRYLHRSGGFLALLRNVGYQSVTVRGSFRRRLGNGQQYEPPEPTRPPEPLEGWNVPSREARQAILDRYR